MRLLSLFFREGKAAPPFPATRVPRKLVSYPRNHQRKSNMSRQSTQLSERISSSDTNANTEKKTNSQSPSTPYSKFSKFEKRLIVALITFAATFSPLSSFIFFPAIEALSSSLNVSVGKINLTVTSYMIMAGIAPAIIGDMADMTGRRIVYLLTISIYCLSNIGLALQSNWTALFILRMVQSAGGAGSCYPISADPPKLSIINKCSDDCYWLWGGLRYS